MLAVVAVVLCLILLAAYLVVPDTGKLEELLGNPQVFVTALAIIVGGVFAANKWRLFRDSKPHLTISH